MFHSKIIPLFVGAFIVSGIAVANVDGTADDNACVQRAQWVDPLTLKSLNGTELIKKAAKDQVVLLGETHETAQHHLWQQQTLAQLYAYNPNIVVGFEMFPRRVQPVLDAWVRGELSKDQFLKESDWDEVWGFNPDLYMPLFEFARMNRLPMIALNVERDLVSAVGDKGWESVEEIMKEGVQKPRPALEDYKDFLKEFFKHHPTSVSEDVSDEDKEIAFNRFVEAQLTWDGAMAQKIANTYKQGGDPLIVGIMGSGHLRFGHGVPHQLEGEKISSTIFLPWTIGQPCEKMEGKLADAVFGVEPDLPPVEQFKPLLGVRIAPAENDIGVLVEQVIEESIAEDAGILKDDIIQKAAGNIVILPKDLISIIRRQAPGTWLPLEVERDGDIIEIIAKFPPYPLG